MPSKTANTNATDSQAATVGSTGSGRNSVTDSVEQSSLPQQILAVVQHKWRNLEKRKKKLDEYKKIGESNLKNDQREALSHFGEVVLLLDLLSDMKKQFESTFAEHESMKKKEAKQAKMAQRKRDNERMREILEIRHVLNCIGDMNIRRDLVASKKISDSDMTLIDKFCETVEPTVCGGKAEAFMSSATECFERLLRREEKPFHDKQSYNYLRNVFSMIYQHVQENTVTKTMEPTAQVEETVQAPVHSEPVKASVQHQEKQHTEQQQQQQHHKPRGSQGDRHGQQRGHQKLEEIVKPGSFSFLQESQIAAANKQREQHVTDTNQLQSDQQPRAWAPPQSSPSRVTQEEHAHHEERYHPQQQQQQQQQQGGNRSRGNRPQGHRNQQRPENRRSNGPNPQMGQQDENNEAAAGQWQPNDDADFSEWKGGDGGLSRAEVGGWIGGQDNRRRSGGSGRGGRGGFHRGGGGGGQQFGENRRHFNRGPRGPVSNQQPRSAPVGGPTGQAYAE